MAWLGGGKAGAAVVLEPLPWWHISAGAPFELTAECSLWGADLISSSPQLLSNRLINQYVCINFYTPY